MGEHRPLVVNLFAGPGAGKSTTAAQLFSMLKTAGIDTEMVREYAKDLVWAGASDVLRHHQIFVFAKQLKRFDDLIIGLSGDEVDVIVTDSPLLFSSVYGSHLPECFHELVRSQFDRMWNLNVKLNRSKDYNPKGRLQTEAEAKALDEKMHNLGIEYDLVTTGTFLGAAEIFEVVMDRIGK